jgi:hypothetical protein
MMMMMVMIMMMTTTTTMYTFLICSMSGTLLAHQSLLDLITSEISGEAYKL